MQGLVKSILVVVAVCAAFVLGYIVRGQQTWLPESVRSPLNHVVAEVEGEVHTEAVIDNESNMATPSQPQAVLPTADDVTILKIVQPDRLQVRLADGSEQWVRLWGVVAPGQAHADYADAHASLAQLVDTLENSNGGVTWQLEIEPQHADPYTCYVWANSRESRVMLNAEVLRSGWCTLGRDGTSSKYHAWLQQAQLEAEAATRGLWR